VKSRTVGGKREVWGRTGLGRGERTAVGTPIRNKIFRNSSDTRNRYRKAEKKGRDGKDEGKRRREGVTASRTFQRRQFAPSQTHKTLPTR